MDEGTEESEACLEVDEREFVCRPYPKLPKFMKHENCSPIAPTRPHPAINR
jgi:hypothetical protein